MKIHESKPKTRRAKQVWEYFADVYGVEPDEMWYNFNCWLHNPAPLGNMWGWWVAVLSEYPTECLDYFDGGVAYATPKMIDEWVEERK